jgi:hypothetical protein
MIMYEYLLDKLLNAKPGDTIEHEDGKTYKVLLARNGCRFVSLGKDTILMEQNIRKDSRFARMARDGARIGWIIPKKGRWKLVWAGKEKHQ